MSRAPAKLIGLHNIKGRIAPGYDADFVIWDPEALIKIDESIILHKNKVNMKCDNPFNLISYLVLDYAVYWKKIAREGVQNICERRKCI